MPRRTDQLTAETKSTVSHRGFKLSALDVKCIAACRAMMRESYGYDVSITVIFKRALLQLVTYYKDELAKSLRGDDGDFLSREEVELWKSAGKGLPVAGELKPWNGKP